VNSQHPSFVQVSTPRVIHDTVDGETLIVDTVSGAYFNLVGSSAILWQQLVACGDVAAVTEQMVATYAGDEKEIRSAVDAFVTSLVEEFILERVAEAAGNLPLPAVGIGTPFVAPVIQKHSDMIDLLLLDPIHEVDVEEGWPIQKSN
jgi:hypothetical protein